MPGTTRGGVRTKSAINNYLATGYVRAPEGVARRGIGAEDPKPKTRARRRPEGSAAEILGKVRRHSLASHNTTDLHIALNNFVINNCTIQDRGATIKIKLSTYRLQIF